MTNVPLPVYPYPLTDAQLAILKQAKASIDTDVLVVPVEAHPGSPGRVLSFGVRPPWLCKCAPIAAENVNRVESVAAALRFWLDDHGSDAYGEAWWLGSLWGVPVREVTDLFILDALQVEAEQRAVKFA